MRICRIWKLVGPIIALLFLSGFPSPAWSQAGPTLVSDKDDYAPGQMAILTGAGFLPGEGIDLSISIDDPSGVHVADYAWTQFDADANGAFAAEYLVPQEAEGMMLVATAMGLRSGLIAKVSFTDSNIGVHNVRFNALGLPNATAITIVGSRPAPGGTHAATPYTESFTTPNNSASVGATLSNVTSGSHTHGAFTFTFSGYPTALPGVGGSYNLTGISITAGSARETVTNFSVNLATGGGSFTTGSAANTGPGGVPTTITGAYTFVPLVVNTPPAIACLDHPTAQLGKLVGLLSGSSFTATVPISYSFSAGKVKATFDLGPAGPSIEDVTVDVATVTDADGDTLAVSTTGPASVTLYGPGAINALLSALALEFIQITADDSYNPTVGPQACDLTTEASVIYRFVGFGSPLSDVAYPTSRIVKRGSTVPTKFKLYDAAGTEICTLLGAAPHYIGAYYYSGAAPGGDPVVTDSGASNDNGVSFRYAGTCGVDGTWIYNMKTDISYYVGSTYEIQAQLNDGEVYETYVSMK